MPISKQPTVFSRVIFVNETNNEIFNGAIQVQWTAEFRHFAAASCELFPIHYANLRHLKCWFGIELSGWGNDHGY